MHSKNVFIAERKSQSCASSFDVLRSWACMLKRASNDNKASLTMLRHQNTANRVHVCGKSKQTMTLMSGATTRKERKRKQEDPYQNGTDGPQAILPGNAALRRPRLKPRVRTAATLCLRRKHEHPMASQELSSEKNPTIGEVNYKLFKKKQHTEFPQRKIESSCFSTYMSCNSNCVKRCPQNTRDPDIHVHMP